MEFTFWIVSARWCFITRQASKGNWFMYWSSVSPTAFFTSSSTCILVHIMSASFGSFAANRWLTQLRKQQRYLTKDNSKSWDLWWVSSKSYWIYHENLLSTNSERVRNSSTWGRSVCTSKGDPSLWRMLWEIEGVKGRDLKAFACWFCWYFSNSYRINNREYSFNEQKYSKETITAS